MFTTDGNAGSATWEKPRLISNNAAAGVFLCAELPATGCAGVLPEAAFSTIVLVVIAAVVSVFVVVFSFLSEAFALDVSLLVSVCVELMVDTRSERARQYALGIAVWPINTTQ